MTPLVYTKREVRVMFDVSNRALERWVKQGRFPAPILPGRWDRQQLDQWRSDKLRHFASLSEPTPKNYRQDDLRL